MPPAPADTGFAERYGPWALVAGGSVGLGAEFARQLALRGLDLVLVARRRAPLEATAEALRAATGRKIRTLELDLGAPDLAERLAPALEGLDVGLLVYNAAHAVIGRFLDTDLSERLHEIDVNCRGPLILCHALGRRLAARGRGGILIMSSMAGFQGSALIPSYAASKAYDTVLGEGLWEELREVGVDVLSFAAGATRTPSFESQNPRGARGLAAPMEPEAVARQALDELSRGPTRVAGARNRLAGFLMTRLLPRRRAVLMISRATRQLYKGGPPPRGA